MGKPPPIGEPLTSEQQRLVESAMPMAYKILYSGPMLESRRDDVAQELMMLLCRLARNYDSAKAQFITYATHSMSLFIRRKRFDYKPMGLTGLSHWEGKMGEFPVETKYLGFETNEYGETMAGHIPAREEGHVSDRMDNGESMKAKMLLIKSIVRDKEWEAISLYYLEGLTLVEIGNRFGVCKEAIRQRLANGFDRVRRYCHVNKIDMVGV